MIKFITFGFSSFIYWNRISPLQNPTTSALLRLLALTWALSPRFGGSSKVLVLFYRSVVPLWFRVLLYFPQRVCLGISGKAKGWPFPRKLFPAAYSSSTKCTCIRSNTTKAEACASSRSPTAWSRCTMADRCGKTSLAYRYVGTKEVNLVHFVP